MNNKELEMKAREHDISDVNEEVLAEVTAATAEEVTAGYKKIENGVVEGYKKIETGVVEGFGKVVDKCVEEAKARLEGKK